ncbi:MAG: hypothetical protein KGD73_10180 [Candidatus Lokiarchaeota archaeon]|nr:hypothetical protein [Candidatus Lokiarchaeota archaeon]
MMKNHYSRAAILNWQQWRLKSYCPHKNWEVLKSRFENTLIFIETLRKEVEKIIPVDILVRRKFGAPLELSYHKLNGYLGQHKRFIEKRIEYCKKNPSYFFSYIKLLEIKIWLKLRFGSCSLSVITLVDDYMNLHRLSIPFSHNNKYQIYKHHPHFNENYFKSIETLEKAYWLGFIFADGTIKNSRVCLYLSASAKYIKSNYNHLIRFCVALGLNPEYIDIIHRLEKGLKIQYRHFTLIQFSSEEMANDLCSLGFKGSRSKATEWPSIKFGNKLLDLAFLLGFYDGEADVGRTRINSANKDLLLIIKNKFNIPYMVLPGTKAYKLSLSGQLVNLMQIIFPKSLELKRHKFRLRNIEVIFNNILSKELLNDLLKVISKNKIADIFGVEVNRISQLIKKWGIEDILVDTRNQKIA